jgi:diguanylate cyclase (GGDEF)-like protein
VFVTLLVAMTDDVQDLWPLFGNPILAAAVAYHVSGAVLVGAIVAAIMGLLLPDLTGAATRGMFSELAIGLSVFVVAGMLIGLRCGRDERRCELLERSTIRDDLTGLHTRDYFVFRVEDDIRRSRRYETDLSVLFVELDSLEEFNSTVGAHRGDLLVAHVAEVLLMAVRETDVLARLQDGLFGIVLPFARAEHALAVGERIKQTIEITDFEGDELEPVTHHTVSIGVAEHVRASDEAIHLLDRAGEGLQRAKAQGGNRIVAGEDPDEVRGASRHKEALS